MSSVIPELEEYPPRASLTKDVYRPFPLLPDNLPSPEEVDAPALANNSLSSLTDALGTEDARKVKLCFSSSQSYWRDLLSFTYHFRTFNDAGIIASAMLMLVRKRGIVGGFELIPESVNHVVVSPSLRWIEAMFTFKTLMPDAKCEGRLKLLPEAGEDSEVTWKIWELSTWLEAFEEYPEDVNKLKAAGRDLNDVKHIETDVLIVGGGNAGIVLAARLKALGVDSIIIDRHPQPGDNWRLRYDCLRFHIAKSNCETPYLSYPKDNPLILTKDMLADHMKNYAAAFNLNILNSSTVEASSFSQSKCIWNARIRTPHGIKTVVARNLVQSTGIGSQKAFIPDIPGKESFKGINIHSAIYKNPEQLSLQGAKSVIVVGSANSAFDVMEDLVTGGLQTTMIARSPTYIFPWTYALAPQGLGLYEVVPADLADKLQMSGPNSISGQLARDLHTHLSLQEKDRYKALAEKGFPFYDSTEGKGDLVQHLLERAGGHFNDIGDGIKLIVEGICSVKGNVEPIKYTPTGLMFTDGTTVDADAIVWCTGFADSDPSVTAEVLGSNKFEEAQDSKDVLGPRDIALLRDAIWGVDKEGEVRGVWKRHLRVKNYWINGGATSHHRYFSKFLAMQIKAALEGMLPEAYRDTPAAAG
ncbi:putative indole-3-pyruvate monooxygenase YUCCA11 [Cytospora mali]|uniref:Indole-3-pyruvate monooxygenase YUCCA11 n=1 Tax=Cytospora mali TaxID=578113 RepID=A0A194V7B0_CYTMA|nr:putative indole-3-pyruvate monooxygenase YUCCA11 [Valsa mali var. pyri (nom. inval.)]